VVSPVLALIEIMRRRHPANWLSPQQMHLMLRMIDLWVRWSGEFLIMSGQPRRLYQP
jgi:hypothetical protein